MADAGPDHDPAECDGDEHAWTVLDGTASRHIDGVEAITSYEWSLEESPLGEGAVLNAQLTLRDNTVTLKILDATEDFHTDDVEVPVIDTTPPWGTIVHPEMDACVGPAKLPLFVLDDFADICALTLYRHYSLPKGPVYSEHGDYHLTLTVSDPSGNVGLPDSVRFAVDTVPPAATMLPEPEVWNFPVLVPFQELFSSDDGDGATGDVVREQVLVDDCVVFDGLIFGDADGLLLDEVVRGDEETLCRMVRLCNTREWRDRVIGVRVTDGGGNVGADSFVKRGTFHANEEDCPQ